MHGCSPSPAPASCLRVWTDGSDQSVTPLYPPSLKGPARGTPQEGTSLPARPASCPVPGSNWTAEPREKHHLDLPSTARRLRGDAEGQRPQRGGQQRAWERMGQGSESCGPGKEERGGEEPRREKGTTKRGRDPDQEGGRRTERERGPDARSRERRTGTRTGRGGRRP